ncbi:hypothetical protein FRC08_011325 [Ceratobasidium sp. 394]|nr:hypothetical protein FRC08_011325 [Ceratobasidium sp. 394]KAG9098683.1 hypothetical protein FS749_003250 [Ceratobasidium sp. UAMH 11750]
MFVDTVLTHSGMLKSPNRHLREWLNEHSKSYVTLLFLRDAAPTGDDCSYCSRPSNGEFYLCRTCVASSPCCKQCLLAGHSQSPSHFIRKWNGNFWESQSLAELGLVLSLRHEGRHCPLSDATVPILVGDLHGFSTVTVSFCGCPSQRSRSSQLLAAGIMSCTDQLPQSAFTFTMLDHLAVFTTTGKCSGFKYWTVLKRLTNTGFPGKVSDRYREMLQTLRKYNHMIQRKRCGVLYQSHPLERDPSDQALYCVACPRPTYNFHENENKTTEDKELVHRHWMSLDSNFQNPRKAKPIDPDDVRFTDGRFYFPSQADYDAYLKMVNSCKRSKDDTKSDCSNHKATQNQFVKYLGTDTSGLGALTCARHSVFMPRGVVDFIKGEMYVL